MSANSSDVVVVVVVVVGINYWYNDNASATETLKISTTDRLAFHHIHLTLYDAEKLQLTQGEDEVMPTAVNLHMTN